MGWTCWWSATKVCSGATAGHLCEPQSRLTKHHTGGIEQESKCRAGGSHGAATARRRHGTFVLHAGDATSLMTLKSAAGASLRPDGVLRDQDGLRMLAKVTACFLSLCLPQIAHCRLHILHGTHGMGWGTAALVLKPVLRSAQSMTMQCSGRTRPSATALMTH